MKITSVTGLTLKRFNKKFNKVLEHFNLPPLNHGLTIIELISNKHE